jgi:hypothetical protein
MSYGVMASTIKRTPYAMQQHSPFIPVTERENCKNGKQRKSWPRKMGRAEKSIYSTKSIHYARVVTQADAAGHHRRR